jgi:hypothetical protein
MKQTVFVGRICDSASNWDFLEIHTTRNAALAAVATAIRENGMESTGELTDEEVVSQYAKLIDGICSVEEVEVQGKDHTSNPLIINLQRMLMPIPQLDDLRIIQGLDPILNGKVTMNSVLFSVEKTNEAFRLQIGEDAPKAWKFAGNAYQAAIENGCSEILFYDPQSNPDLPRGDEIPDQGETETVYPCECSECGQAIESANEAEVTYCGSMHKGDCYEQHLQSCAVCDEDGKYPHDD